MLSATSHIGLEFLTKFLNMSKLQNRLILLYQSLPLQIHLEETQLIVDEMEEIENEVDTDLLYPIENDVQERSTTLKQEVPTRWSSALRMAKSVLTNITFVTRILEISKKYELILSSRIYNVCKH